MDVTQIEHARNSPALYPLNPLATMEQAPPINSAPKLVFCDNDIEHGRHRRAISGVSSTQETLTSAIAAAEALLAIDLDVSLDRTVTNPCATEHVGHLRTSGSHQSRQQVETKQESRIFDPPDEVLEHLKRMVRTFAGHKPNYGELLD
jgi:hypothetical protein